MFSGGHRASFKSKIFIFRVLKGFGPIRILKTLFFFFFGAADLLAEVLISFCFEQQTVFLLKCS